MNTRAQFPVAVLVLLLVASVSCSPQIAVPVTSTTIPDPHNHNVDVTNNSLGPQNAAEFRMIEIQIEPDTVLTDPIINQPETFQAYSMCNPECTVLIEDLANLVVYQLQAPSMLTTRPYSDLIWVTDSILVFDQWTQPHFGVHYAVDIVGQELVLASPFTDQP